MALTGILCSATGTDSSRSASASSLQTETTAQQAPPLPRGSIRLQKAACSPTSLHFFLPQGLTVWLA